ncbi:MAG: type II secretion system F family protein [bacterium]
MDSFIDIATDRQNIIALLAAVAAMASVFTILAPMFETDPMKGRLKKVTDYRENLRQQHRDSLTKKPNVKLRTETPDGMGKQIVEQLKLLEVFDAQSAAKKLAMAGMRGERPVMTFMLARLATPFIAGIGTAIYVYLFGGLNLEGFMRLLVCGGAFAGGFYLPNVYVSNKIQARQQAMSLAFPDALDLLLICVESGMSIEHALNKVSEEISGSCSELAEEISLTTAELSYLPERRIAYENLGDRTGLEGVKSVVTALVQSETYGTPLGASLRVMASENREMRMQAAEKKAAALPPKLTVPMILFNLPVLFVIILSPAIMRVMGNA